MALLANLISQVTRIVEIYATYQQDVASIMSEEMSHMTWAVNNDFVKGGSMGQRILFIRGLRNIISDGIKYAWPDILSPDVSLVNPE